MSDLNHSIFLPTTKPLPPNSCSWITMQQSGLLVHTVLQFVRKKKSNGGKNLGLPYFPIFSLSLLDLTVSLPGN